jgi:hypothetical protein
VSYGIHNVGQICRIYNAILLNDADLPEELDILTPSYGTICPFQKGGKRRGEKI